MQTDLRMKGRGCLILACSALACCLAAPAAESADARSAHAEAGIKHIKVYYQPGRFGGWPANHGIWSWGDEILVGFSAGYHKDLGPTRFISPGRIASRIPTAITSRP